jgi:23S rRNA pseudouridine2457 synthase
MTAQHFYFAVYKPYGYLSQFVCEHKNKKLLGELFNFPEGTMAVGRLDEDSEGLLLLTTNGAASLDIRSKKIEKEYFVQVDGLISEEAIFKLQHGVEITVGKEKYKTLPCTVFNLETEPALPLRGKKIRDERHGPTSWISVTITEGKFRQVRKMTAAVNFPTLRLVRVRIGNLMVGDLKPGEVKELNDFSFSA